MKQNRTPSIIDSGPAPEAAVMSVGQLLPRAAMLNRAQSIRLIAMDGTESRMSYADLLGEASKMLAGLREAGVQAPDRVALCLGESRDVLVTFWACLLGGFVIVPVSDTQTVARKDLGCRWLVADQPVHGGPDWLGSVATLGDQSPDFVWCNNDRDDIAMVAITAGSTGTPKAVLLSHGNILSRSAATVQDNGLDSTAVSFNWLPLDHVGGLVMFHVRDVYVGCTQVHAPRLWIQQNPRRWLDISDEYRVTVGWGTDSALALIAAHASADPARTWDLSRLGYVMNGGEPVKAGTIRRFFAALSRHGLPGTAMRPGWGMTETAGGVVDYRIDLAACSGSERIVPVGRPHFGMSVRVVDEANRTVDEGSRGRLQVRGASVTPGYADGGVTRAVTDDGWLDTGDLGYVSGGLLTVTGHAADEFRINGSLYRGHEIETTVAALGFIDEMYVAACPGTGMEGGLVIAYHHDGSFSHRKAARMIREVVKDAHDLNVLQVVPVSKEGFPRTRTGKLQRSRLQVRLAQQSIRNTF